MAPLFYVFRTDVANHIKWEKQHQKNRLEKEIEIKKKCEPQCG